jgi:protocatechuate 3,4-dioxygenase beta subunit
MIKQKYGIAFIIVAVLWPVMGAAATVGIQKNKARMSGIVVSDSGRPVKFATVQLYLEQPSGRGGGDSSPSTMTDRKGNFVFENLQPGVYRLQVYQVGFISPQHTGESSIQIAVEEGQDVTDVEIELTSGSAITGKVTDDDGDPIINVSVTAWRKDQQGYLQQVNQSQTDDRGVYRVFGLPSGEYVVSCHVPQNIGRQASYGIVYYPDAIIQKEATVLSLGGGSECAGIDFQIQSNKGVTLTGKITVRSSNQPVAGLGITIYGEQLSLTTVTGPDGQYEFNGLPPGRFHMQLHPTIQNIVPIQRQVEVQSKGTTRYDIQLEDGAQIIGRIELIGDRLVANPDQLYINAEVTPVKMDANQPHIGSVRVKVEPDGTFVVGGLPAARVRFTAQSPNQSCFLKGVYRGETELPRGEVIIEANKKVINIRLVLSDQVGTVRGNVRPRDSQVRSFQVILVPADASFWNDYQSYRYGWSDGQQPFQLEGVPAGRYLVFTVDSTIGFGGEASIRQLHSRAMEVNIRPGDVEDIEVTPLDLDRR